MSEVRAVVVSYTLRKHPNADTLSIADIKGLAWQVVVKTEEFKPQGTAIYIPVDSVVPPTEGFAFLKDTKYRVKPIKLRGEYSFGVLLPNKEGLEIGTDITEKMGIKKYEPPIPLITNGDVIRSLPWIIRYTDVERYENFPDILIEGEEVVVTEKIHGSNLRVAKEEENLFVGGHNCMFKESNRNLYWSALRKNGLDAVLLKKLPDRVILFGEVYGAKVQNLNYGLNTRKIVFFDAFQDGKYLDWDNFIKLIKEIGLDLPPILYREKYSLDKIKTLRKGQTMLSGNHLKEGVVVKPVIERFDNRLGRVILKFINPEHEISKGRTDHH